MHTNDKRGLICAAVFTVWVSLMTGCAVAPSSPSQSTSTPSSSAAVKVIVSPGAIGLTQGGTYTFEAGVSGFISSAVNWSIQEGSQGGSITTSGVYTAPASMGLYHVLATSQADPAQSAIATVNVVSTGFSPAGNLGTARLQHTANLLPNGKVLIAGGGYGPDTSDGYWVADQAELFDPATGAFNSAGQISRDGHTATLLQTGDVLLTGGEIGWSGYFPIVSQTAEVRISSSGLSQPTGSMAFGREEHAAALLKDGRVLITGGVIPAGISWQAVAEAEIYDPVSRTFAPVGSMHVARAFHTATLLSNGKVLIAGGGYGNESNGRTAEIFDPSTGSFTVTGSMFADHGYGAAILLPSGKVLMTGGSTITELYDPTTGKFTRTGDMSVARGNRTATLLRNGTVLIAGGAISPGTATATTEIYDPATGIFSMGPAMGQARFSHTATLLQDGRVVIIGGASLSGVYVNALSSAEIFQ
jgi:large repetitive protein